MILKLITIKTNSMFIKLWKYKNLFKNVEEIKTWCDLWNDENNLFIRFKNIKTILL